MTDTLTDSPEHPERKGVKCELCGTLTDVENVVTVRGRFYCGDCAEAGRALDELQPFREKYDNRTIRVTVLGCAIALILFVTGSTVLLIYTFMRIDTQMECKARMEKLYRVLVQYAAESSLYPPANNDLRPLFGPDLNLHLFECPGTTNTVTTREHLKDNATAPNGPGMSYFYQGGFGYPIETGDEARPLFWDQSPANHRGRGVNVIFKDGHHEYWKHRVPELHPPGGAASAPDGTGTVPEGIETVPVDSAAAPQ